jgi:hypothetical protein
MIDSEFEGMAPVRRLSDAIAEQVRVDPGDFLVRWALVCDWQQPDGTRALTSVRSEGSTHWEFNGLLAAGVQDCDHDEDDGQ